MSLISQVARIPILSPTAASTSHCEPMSRTPYSWFYPRAHSLDEQPFFVADRALPFRRLCGGDNVVNRRVRTSSSKTSRGFCPPHAPSLIPAFTRSPVRGLSGALRHSVFCFASRPFGFRFLPKEIRFKTGTERRANFFRFPPKKQTFGTWEPGPLPRLCHV